ncbi:MAG TPA: hypothetical protein VHW64_09255 [Nocardioides sp.]|uniref:hypothetical protein n=1 Tax=Nocardioides sp. TaxID=35761 RepID=UPI002E356936|nr:hypothetical protein [Nocardioides sp.]HEX3930879.1 hypothetical protein [Nocardioides sp.]
MRIAPPLVTLAVVAALSPAVASSYAGEPAGQPGGPAGRSAVRGVKPVHVPKAARAVGTRHPDHVVGKGVPASCTSAAVVKAVAAGGVITFDCGSAPVTIAMRHTAKVVNGHQTAHGLRSTRRVVIDGGGLVTLSGMGRRRILYQDTCDPRQVWTTSHCQNQAFPRLVVQNLTLEDGDSTGNHYEGGGGGAVFDRGGRLKVVSTTFLGNRCDRTGPDLGGAAVRALSQFHGRPVYVVHSTFRGGRCSNGSGLSSIGVSWTVLNSTFQGNRATGRGANPQEDGTPGGGSGGAIYTDGDTYTVRVAGTLMRHNHANEGGGAIFYVSNDSSGRLHLRWSTLEDNVSAKFENLPGIYFLGRGSVDVRHTVLR